MAGLPNKLTGAEQGVAVRQNINAISDYVAQVDAKYAALAAAYGNPPNNPYAPLVGVVASAKATAWAAVTSKGSITWGTPFATTSNGYGVIPAMVGLPWDLASKSMLFGYLQSNATVPTGSGQTSNASYAAARRIALDANLAPTISTPDVAVPGNGSTGANYFAVSVGAFTSGVAVSASAVKALVPSMSYSQQAVFYGFLHKTSFNWDGTNLTISTEGQMFGAFAGAGGSNNSTTTATLVLNASANINGVLVNNGGWLSVGTMTYDCSTLDTGSSTGISYKEWRLSMAGGCCHDTFGAGSVVQSSPASTTIADTTTRLTVSTEVRDAILGLLGTSTCRLSGKSWNGGAPNIVCLTPTRYFVQWIDTSGNRWAVVLVYSAANGTLTPFGNSYYSGGQIGSLSLGAMGVLTFGPNVFYALAKGAGNQGLILAKVVFDTTQPAGAELYSNASDNIAFNALAQYAATGAVNSVSPRGTLRMDTDLAVFYGIANVTPSGGSAANVCFAESFALA